MIDVWTDGSCLGNPGYGGWAAVSRDFEISGALEKTTNNVMELTAILRALEKCKEVGATDVRIWTDSFYCKNGITTWIHGWKRNRWMTSNGQPVKNRELWESIDAATGAFQSIEWNWVKAHNGHPQNEAVDTLARARATELKNSSQEELLKRWAEKAAGYRWLHNWSRLHYKRQNDIMSYPSIVIASITGVGGFAVLSPDNDNRDDDTKTKIMYVQYFFAFLNVIGGILTSISKFSQSSYLAERHSVMANAYSKFYRNIDMELSIERENRPPMLEYVVKMRKDYDRLLDDAPDIPAVAIAAFNEHFKDACADMAVPDVCNGLSILSAENNANERAKRNWVTLGKLFRKSTSNASLNNNV